MEAEVEVVGSGGWGFMELWVVRGGVELAVAGVTEEPSSLQPVMERVPTRTERSVV